MRFRMKGDKGKSLESICTTTCLFFHFLLIWVFTEHPFLCKYSHWVLGKNGENGNQWGEGEAMMMAGSHWETRWVWLLDMSK